MKTIEIELPVAELKSILPGLGKIIPRHSTLPVLGCMKLSLDAPGENISIQAHNLDEAATVRLPNKIGGNPGQILVPFDLLSKIIKGCPPDSSVRFIGSEKESRLRYTVAGNTVERLLEYFPAGEFPEVKPIDGELLALPENFKTALKEALDCASEDSSRYVLNGACLDVRAKDAHYVVGTDGRHLYSANSFQFNLPEPLIIPTRKFITWPGFVADGAWKLRMQPVVRLKPEEKNKGQEEPAWFKLESERWTYLAKAIDGQYPNWKQVVPTDTAKWTQVLLSAEAVATLQQAIPLLPGADTVNQALVLEVAENRLALRARGKDDTLDTRMVVPEVRTTGQPVEVALNRAFLLQALRFGFAEIRIEDSLAPLVFVGPTKTLVVMPVRLDGPAAPPVSAPVDTTPVPSQPSPPESASAVPPSTAEAEHPTEAKRNTMPENTGTTPHRNSTNGNGSSKRNEEAECAFGAVLDRLDSLKSSLRQVLSDLSETQTLIRAAAREKKATEKEVESVRTALRSLQKVEL